MKKTKCCGSCAFFCDRANVTGAGLCAGHALFVTRYASDDAKMCKFYQEVIKVKSNGRREKEN